MPCLCQLLRHLSGLPNYCLFCVDGYTRTSWKCQNNRNVQFAFTLDTTPAAFLPKIDRFVATLLGTLGENRINTYAVTIESVVEGSNYCQRHSYSHEWQLKHLYRHCIDHQCGQQQQRHLWLPIKSTSVVATGKHSSDDRTMLIIG